MAKGFLIKLDDEHMLMKNKLIKNKVNVSKILKSKLKEVYLELEKSTD